MHAAGGELALSQFAIHRSGRDAIGHGNPRAHQCGDILIRKMGFHRVVSFIGDGHNPLWVRLMLGNNGEGCLNG